MDSRLAVGRTHRPQAPMNREYVETVRLLLDIAPEVFRSRHFALKGGTALNLFVQDMPRLSVDIDAVLVDRTLSRPVALQVISDELRSVKARLESKQVRVTLLATNQAEEAKLLATSVSAEVKVEINFVFRGTVLPVSSRPLVALARDLFTTDVVLPVLDTAELYGSKLVAAMDRQHPRDMFDVIHMLRRFGMQEAIVECFVAYLAGHNRPVHEVLFPKAKPLETVFHNEFAGMTRSPVTLAELVQAQHHLLEQLPRALTAEHREFLL